MKTTIMIHIFLALACRFAIADALIPDRISEGDSAIHNGNLFKECTKGIDSLKGVYEFGESEFEWAVAIIPYLDGFIVQTSSVLYSTRAKTFLRVYSTAQKARLADGVFSIPKPHRSEGHFEGRFIEKKGDQKVVGILLNGNSQHAGKVFLPEVGFYSRKLEDEFGDHYRLSCTALDRASLAKLSDTELSLMRNEIYAYYGRIFADPVLKEHFAKMEWYHPWQSDVTDCISEIEWANIRAIQNQESQRKR